MKNDYVSFGRSVSDLKAHLGLTTKYRKKILNADMLNRLHNVLENLCTQWECKLVEFNAQKDHVHILFQYHPNITLSKFVNNIKSVTSRKLRQEFPKEVSKEYMKDALWNGSYFIASCGGVTITTLKQYIENQNNPVS
jgi:putative transposase